VLLFATLPLATSAFCTVAALPTSLLTASQLTSCRMRSFCANALVTLLLSARRVYVCVSSGSLVFCKVN
jgi:hypothetical protein